MTNETVTLPLLPLKSGVILPGMVFTMALESDEARVAVEAARSAGGRLLLVPTSKVATRVSASSPR